MKPKDEKRTVKFTIMISPKEKSLIDTLHKDCGVSRVQLLIDALNEYENRRNLAKSKQLKIGLTDKKEFR